MFMQDDPQEKLYMFMKNDDLEVVDLKDMMAYSVLAPGSSEIALT